MGAPFGAPIRVYDPGRLLGNHVYRIITGGKAFQRHFQFDHLIRCRRRAQRNFRGAATAKRIDIGLSQADLRNAPDRIAEGIVVPLTRVAIDGNGQLRREQGFQRYDDCRTGDGLRPIADPKK